MATETKARLRDRREPGHFWADNEIIDVFGDELGQNGISVYLTMTRYCFGTEVRLSLREIAAAARMSKDTVARSMKVLVALGLVIETKGRLTKTVSTWSLANVKALVREYVTQSVSPRDRLLEAKTQESIRTARQSTLAGMVKEQTANCLTVRQFVSDADSVDKKNCVAPDATDLSQNCTDFATDLSQSEGVHLYSKTQDTKLQDTTPLPPSQATGETSFDSRPATKTQSAGTACAEAVAKVMRELDIADIRMERVISRAMAKHREKTDMTADCNAVAELMIRRRGEYLALSEMLAFQVGVRKFFNLGVWTDSRQWVLDPKKVEEVRVAARARVGSRDG